MSPSPRRIRHGAVARRPDPVLHLHRLENEQELAPDDGLAGETRTCRTRPGIGARRSPRSAPVAVGRPGRRRIRRPPLRTTRRRARPRGATRTGRCRRPETSTTSRAEPSDRTRNATGRRRASATSASRRTSRASWPPPRSSRAHARHPDAASHGSSGEPLRRPRSRGTRTASRRAEGASGRDPGGGRRLGRPSGGQQRRPGRSSSGPTANSSLPGTAASSRLLVSTPMTTQSAQRPARPLDRRLAVRPGHDELGEQRVELEPDPRSARHAGSPRALPAPKALRTRASSPERGRNSTGSSA